MKLSEELKDAICKKLEDYGIMLVDKESNVFDIQVIHKDYLFEKIQEAIDEVGSHENNNLFN